MSGMRIEPYKPRRTLWRSQTAAGTAPVNGSNAEPNVRFPSPRCRYRDVMTTSNRLAQETSPYLRQHKDNPVDWYAWGPEAFAAAKQRDCPISGERLGSMDTPIKVTLNGEEVFLCCEGCKADAEADPDATLAKVRK